MKLLTEVINQGLCCGCGTCAGVCPTEAITMKATDGLFVPEIDETACNKCNLCVKSCPGHSVDFKTLRSRIFGKEPEGNFIGNYLQCYIGHSMDSMVRYNSTSGGILTQLLMFALENGLLDGALVTRMRKNNPLESGRY
jgi:coenzyme F420 hydrogenase subunit beta